MVKFIDIKEHNIAIECNNKKQLCELVDYLKIFGYDYGTGETDNNVEDIKLLDMYYFGDKCFISLDRNKTCHSRNYASCGKGYQDTCYKFSQIDWNICL
jgi:hypothetical protein